jgi:hypothetical protein
MQSAFSRVSSLGRVDIILLIMSRARGRGKRAAVASS